MPVSLWVKELNENNRYSVRFWQPQHLRSLPQFLSRLAREFALYPSPAGLPFRYFLSVEIKVNPSLRRRQQQHNPHIVRFPSPLGVDFFVSVLLSWEVDQRLVLGALKEYFAPLTAQKHWHWRARSLQSKLIH